MNSKHIFAIIFLLIMIPGALAAYATFRHPAIVIADGKDIDLNGQSIGNGTIANFTYFRTNYTNLSSSPLPLRDVDIVQPGIATLTDFFMGKHITSTQNSYYSNIYVYTDDNSVNNGDHIAVTAVSNARANRNVTGTGSGGDEWAFYGMSNNKGFNASGIVMELSPTNTCCEMLDNGSQPLFYGIQIYPDGATYNVTRGISIVGKSPSIGFQTGLHIGQFIDYGIQLIPGTVGKNGQIGIDMGNTKIDNSTQVNVLASTDTGNQTNIGRGGIELYKTGGTPYIDAKNSNVDFDARIFMSPTFGWSFSVGGNGNIVTTSITPKGNLSLPSISGCINMKSPDGTAYQVMIANGGTINIVAGTCV